MAVSVHGTVRLEVARDPIAARNMPMRQTNRSSTFNSVAIADRTMAPAKRGRDESNHASHRGRARIQQSLLTESRPRPELTTTPRRRCLAHVNLRFAGGVRRRPLP